MIVRLAGLALCLMLIGAAPAKRIDWTRHVTATPAGAYVMGNPAAKVKLVEYVSFTCPHCAHFIAEAKQPLAHDYVATGKVSVELRHAVRDRLDFIATLLARCAGPGRFFGATEAIFAAQQQWIEKGSAYEQANADALAKLGMDEAMKREARGAGLDAIVAARGVTAAQIDKCLTDKAQHKLIGAMTEAAWNETKIPGTPAFAIGGALVPDAASWAALQPALSAAAQ